MKDYPWRCKISDARKTPLERSMCRQHTIKMFFRTQVHGSKRILSKPLTTAFLLIRKIGTFWFNWTTEDSLKLTATSCLAYFIISKCFRTVDKPWSVKWIYTDSHDRIIARTAARQEEAPKRRNLLLSLSIDKLCEFLLLLMRRA